jgi:predicted SAM-dependent methyltransferase
MARSRKPMGSSMSQTLSHRETEVIKQYWLVYGAQGFGQLVFVLAFGNMPTSSVGGIKINIGCGLSGIAGWENLDNSPTIWVSRIPLLNRLLKTPAWPRDVRRYDVRKGLPYADGSVRYVYSSHTFEHFTYNESLAIAKECLRVLAPGGILRIVVPDLSLIVREYLADAGAQAAQTFLSRLSLNHSLQDFVHPGSNHSQMFDAKLLLHLLREAGFVQLEVSSYREGMIPEIDQLELEVRCRESLYVEALK